MKQLSSIYPALILSLLPLATVSAQDAKGKTPQDPGKVIPGKKGETPKTPEIEEPVKLVLSKQEGQRNLENLSSPNWKVRELATRVLIEAGAQAYPFAREGLRSNDPEVRLRCHYILKRPEILTEQLLDKMVKDPNSIVAIESFHRFSKEPELFRYALLRKAREYAVNKSSKQQVQRLAICLDVLADLAQPEDTKQLLALLRFDLQEAHGVSGPMPLLTEVLARMPADKVIKGALEVLAAADKSPNAYQGTQACEVLGAYGTLAVLPHLVKALKHEGSLTRMAVAEAFRSLSPNEDQLLSLVPLLKDEDEDAIVVVLDLFTEFRCKKAIPHIIKALEHESEKVHQKAAIAVGALADPRAEKTLRAYLWPKVMGTPEERKQKILDKAAMRGFTAWALARMKKTKAAELIALLNAKQGLDYHVCLALATLGTKPAIKNLEFHARRQGGNSPLDRQRQTFAVAALGLTKDPSSSQILFDIAKKFPDANLGTLAITSLRDQNTAVSKAKLLALVDHTSSSRLLTNLYDYLGTLKVRAAVPVLIKRLEALSGNSYLLNRLANALGNLGGKDAVEALRKKYKQLGATRLTERRYVAWALARAGERSFIKEIIAQTKKSSAGTRRGYQLNSLGIDYLYAHDWKGAGLAFRRMTWLDPATQYSSYNMACIYGLQKNTGPAFRLLRRSIKESKSYWVGNWRHVSTDGDLHSLHPDQRFQRLTQHLRLEAQFIEPRVQP